ncbi:MAG: PD40 domain-containing protein [Candidatus Levybacteria bacterium]|nr:PD40 domain-containing protein [Candidatus Levybacteria bacterium]
MSKESDSYKKRLSEQGLWLSGTILTIAAITSACNAKNNDPISTTDTPPPTSTSEHISPTTQTEITPLKENGLEDLSGKILVRSFPDGFGQDINFDEQSDIPDFDLSVNLWLINPNGSEKILISERSSINAPVLWSPKGDMFAALIEGDSYFDFQNDQWNVFDLKGNVIATLGKGFATLIPEEDVSWSPTDNSLIYSQKFGGIFEYNINTQHTREFITTTGRTLDNSPAISPDGSKLIYVHHEFGSNYYVTLAKLDPNKLPHKGNEHNLGVINPELKVLSSGEFSGDVPFRFLWTRDGQKVIWAQETISNDNFDQAIYIADVNRELVTRIDLNWCTSWPSKIGDNIDLSKDGQTILFTCNDSLYATDLNGDITTILDSEDLKLFLKLPNYQDGFVEYPRWSPDGKHIIFYSFPDDIIIVKNDGSDIEKVPFTEALLNTGGVEWSPK